MKLNLIDISPTFVGQVPIPYTRPRRQWWYSIVDRHKERVFVDKSLVGKTVKVKRAIVRTGYFFEHTDINSWNIQETVDRIMTQKLERAGIKDVSKEMLKSLITLFGHGIETSSIYLARKEWLYQVYRLPEYQKHKDLRTFWYVNIADVNPEPEAEITITAIKAHQIGIHYPAHIPTSMYEDDYEPGGLCDSLYQQVYWGYGLIARNYEDFADNYYAIHPLDIESVV
jgi:hypothetical protein